jgi:hypothetical protein
MRRRPYYRSRRVFVIGVFCLGLAGPAVLLRAWGSAGSAVVVEHDGARRTVELGRDPSVRHALALAHVQLIPAHVLSARSHRPIAGHDLLPVVLLNGHAAELTSVITGRRNRLTVTDSHDIIEAVVVRTGVAAPPPPAPRVLHKLWHPGREGVSAGATDGALSGEVVSAGTTVSPSSPTPVTDKLVALTFDDGPWPGTVQFLQVLQQARVTATFCMIGRQVVAHPE